MYTFIRLVTMPRVCDKCGKMNTQPSALVVDPSGTTRYYHPACARWLRGVGMKALYAQATHTRNVARIMRRGRNTYWTLGNICKRFFGI